MTDQPIRLRDGSPVDPALTYKLREIHPASLLHLARRDPRRFARYLVERFYNLTPLPGDIVEDFVRNVVGQVQAVGVDTVTLLVAPGTEYQRRGRAVFDELPIGSRGRELALWITVVNGQPQPTLQVLGVDRHDWRRWTRIP